jgi:uncharacterized membrane protein
MTKTLSFAVVHFTVAFTVAYLITGSWVAGSLTALIEPCINTVAYYLHEKVWSRRVPPAGDAATSTWRPQPAPV